MVLGYFEAYSGGFEADSTDVPLLVLAAQVASRAVVGAYWLRAYAFYADATRAERVYFAVFPVYVPLPCF